MECCDIDPNREAIDQFFSQSTICVGALYPNESGRKWANTKAVDRDEKAAGRFGFLPPIGATDVAGLEDKQSAHAGRFSSQQTKKH